ncbi:MAG: hypothetical protein PHT25_03560, partial [Bacteroidales bacterium]|nr:hypothetical protein [Bacteroidales bacterium]
MPEISIFKCPLFGDQVNILMAGETSTNLVKGGGVSITMSRLISKVTVVFDKSSLSGGTNINITKIELKNVA